METRDSAEEKRRKNAEVKLQKVQGNSKIEIRENKLQTLETRSGNTFLKLVGGDALGKRQLNVKGSELLKRICHREDSSKWNRSCAFDSWCTGVVYRCESLAMAPHTKQQLLIKSSTTPKGMKAKKEGTIDTLALTESLGLKTHRRETPMAWLKDDDDTLLQRLSGCYPRQMETKTLDLCTVDWETVSAVFSGRRKAKDCKKRWRTSLDPHLRRGKWTKEEDRRLVEMYNRYGTSWQLVALHIAGRTEHQCSKRYLEVLDPKVANRLQPWTEAEDLQLIDLVKKNGTKWRAIAANLESRPPLTCRNRWRHLLTAVVRQRASAQVVARMSEVAPVIKQEDESAYSESPLSNPPSAPSTLSSLTNPSLSNPPSPSLSNPANAPPVLPNAHPSSTLRNVPLLPEQKLTEEMLAQVRASQRLPATTEWLYTVPEKGVSGTIGSMLLVEALVLQAAAQHVRIELHQHHYHQGSQPAYTDVARFQHFNYLPPLTPVPQLQLSASLPDEENRQDLRRLLNPGTAHKTTEDDGIDFYESLRTLKKPDNKSEFPVSQHHPLHSSTPGPEDWGIDEEEHDFMASFGLYAYMRDKPEAPAPAEEADEFFPFNPS